MRPLNCKPGLAIAALLLALPLAAQERDPTQPPARAQVATGTDSGKPATPEIDSAAVIRRDGKPYLVVGTRLYAAGQKVGPYTLERVSETEVWLRNGKELRKLQRFTGIERRTSIERSTP
jgi:hypothetical protein